MSWPFQPLPLAAGSSASAATYASAPQVPSHRPRSVAVYALSLAFVPVLAVAPETITLDKWAPRYPDQIARRAVQQPSGGVAPVFVPDVTQPVPLGSWAPTYPDRLSRSRVTFAPTVFVATVAAPDLGLIEWAPRYPDHTLGRRRVANFQTLASPVFVPDVTEPVPTLAWAPRYPDRIPKRRRPVDVPPVFVPDVTPPVPALAWAPRYPDRVPGRRRVAVFPLPVAPVFVPDVTTPVPARSWAPVFPDRVPWRKTVRHDRGAYIALVDAFGPICIHVAQDDFWPRAITIRIAVPDAGSLASTWPEAITIRLAAPSVAMASTWPRVLDVEGC